MKTSFLRANLVLSVMLTVLCGSVMAEAYPYVKLNGRQLVEDFDKDGRYEPFFVKGVGYAPVPIGQFIGVDGDRSSVCVYTGPFPLEYPELRFRHDSPDGAYDCGDDGKNFYQNPAVFERDFPLLQDMHANTIRTWGKVTSELLDKAQENNLKVIAGFWVDHGLDYTFPEPTGRTDRQNIINDFAEYVNLFKNDPAILIWGLSNENNIHFCPCSLGSNCDREAQAIGYYQLMNDMALKAKEVEGDASHLVMVVSAELTDDVVNYAQYMPAVDILGINSYRGRNFDGWPEGELNLFDKFDSHFPDKSMIVTEFGADAWNIDGNRDHPEDGFEDPVAQADYVVSAWQDIVVHSVFSGGPGNGGVVFDYADGWNKYGKPDDPDKECPWVSSDWTPSVITQDHDYTDPEIFGSSMPDGVENPEWWGIMSVEQNQNPGGIDRVHPRLVYDGLQAEFAPLSVTDKTKAARRRKVVFAAMVEGGAGVKNVDLKVGYPGGQWVTYPMRYKRRKDVYIYKKKLSRGETPVTLKYQFIATDNAGNREKTEIFTLNVR